MLMQKYKQKSSPHLCELLCFATKMVSPAVGADEGTCKERSDSKGILQKFRLTSVATE